MTIHSTNAYLINISYFISEMFVPYIYLYICTYDLLIHVPGVMNAADYYGLDELRRACAGFVQCCINVDTVCALLASAERYIQYKCTKSLVQKVYFIVVLNIRIISVNVGGALFHIGYILVVT
jgi:hypothetical protein